MACFAGDTVAHGVTLETWHDIESFYDSQSGQSPIVQLCRVTNLFHAYFDLPLISWTAIDTDTTDISWAAVDYSTTRDPMSDLVDLLNEVKHKLLAISSATFIECEDCHWKRFNDHNTIYISLLGITITDNREDWLQVILDLRSVLEAMEASLIERDAWPTYNIVFSTGLTPSPGANLSGSGTKNYLYLDLIEYGLTASDATHFVRFGADVGVQAQQYPGEAVCGDNIHFTTGPLAVYYDRGGQALWAGVGERYYTLFRENLEIGEDPNFCDCDQYYGSSGWVTNVSPPQVGWFHRTNISKRYTFSEPVWPIGFDVSLLNGIEMPWEIQANYSAELPNISWSASETSGSRILVSGGVFNDTPIDIDFEMTNANVSTDTWPENKTVDFKLLADEFIVTVCQDACGNWHLSE